MNNNVVDMQEYRDRKPEHRRRHGNPLFEEGLHTRIPIVSRAVLLALPAIKSDDPHAARDAENSFKSPQEVEAQNARHIGSPALYVVPTPAPVETSPVVPVANPDTVAPVFSLEAARQLVDDSHVQHAEQVSQITRQQTDAQVTSLADRRAAAAQEADAALENWFLQSNWKSDNAPANFLADEVDRHAA